MEDFNNTIRQNMNANGGGLATNITGRYESNRHAIARNEKVTFGEASKELSKKKNGGFKISASELLELYRTLYGEPEWHHAGFLPKQYGGGMKKTYFLDNIPTVDDVLKWQDKALKKKQEQEDFAEIERKRQLEKDRFVKKYGEHFSRVAQAPKYSVVDTEEMNGKFGWFESQPYKYNLPVYYSGVFFKSQKTLDKYNAL